MAPRKPANQDSEVETKPPGPLTPRSTALELGATEGALVFRADEDPLAYFPNKDTLEPHIEQMALLLFIANDPELLALAKRKHLSQLQNPN